VSSVHIPAALRRGLRRGVIPALACMLLAGSPACVRVKAEGQAASTPGCTLRIHVDGFRNTRGNLGTAIYKTADGWPEDTSKSFRHGPAPIDVKTRTAVGDWTGLPPGDYGVVAIHDENSNHKLDRNFVGIPKEGFGFANNPHVGLSAPAFREAVVHVGCPVTEITIHLQFK
jgi:uncharacterized protein (DUF2141 family)